MPQWLCAAAWLWCVAVPGELDAPRPTASVLPNDEVLGSHAEQIQPPRTSMAGGYAARRPACVVEAADARR